MVIHAKGFATSTGAREEDELASAYSPDPGGHGRVVPPRAAAAARLDGVTEYLVPLAATDAERRELDAALKSAVPLSAFDAAR